MILAPRPKFYEHGSNTAGCCPAIKAALCSFLGGVFLVACRSELPILHPLKGGNACHFLLAACRPQFSDFKPLKDGEMLDNFFWVLFCPFPVPKWTFPVSNLTHLGPLSPPPPCLKRSAAQTTWIYPLKPTLDACRIFVLPLSRPFWFKISPFRCQT